MRSLEPGCHAYFWGFASMTCPNGKQQFDTNFQLLFHSWEFHSFQTIWIRETMELHIFGRSWDGRESNFGSIPIWSSCLVWLPDTKNCWSFMKLWTISKFLPWHQYWMTPTGCWWMKSTVSNETLESCVFALYNPFHFSMLISWQFSTVHLGSGLPPDSAAFAEGDLQEPGRWAVRHAMRHAFVKARRRW